MKLKSVSIAIIIASLLVSSTGCGKKNSKPDTPNTSNYTENTRDVSGKKAKVLDISNYAKISEYGANGKGTITYTIDYDSLVGENLEFFGLLSEDILSAENIKTDLKNYISLSVDKEDSLANGDEIKISWNITNADNFKDKYNVILQSKDSTYTVCELTDSIELNPFDYIEVMLNGSEPKFNIKNYTSDGDETLTVLKRFFRPCYLDENGEITTNVPQLSGQPNCNFTYVLDEKGIEYLTSNGIIPTVTQQTYVLTEDYTFKPKE